MSGNLLERIHADRFDDDLRMLTDDLDLTTKDLLSLARVQYMLADPTQHWLMTSDGDRAAAQVRAVLLMQAAQLATNLTELVSRI